MYSHQQFNLLGFSSNFASKIWLLFWIFEFFENFNLNFELREALVLGHNCTSTKWFNILLFKSFPWENLKFSTPSSPILKNP